MTHTMTLSASKNLGLVVNAALLLAILGLGLAQLVILPLALLPSNPAWGWLMLLPVLLTNTAWVLIHEAIHGVFLPHKAANRWAAALRLNFNLHGAHHERPGLGSWQLAAHHAQSQAGFQGNWTAALLAQFRGPIPEHQLISGAGGRPCR
ncbi:MAG: hypothetical protein ACK4TK_06845 [Thiobacillaceae bacterium]